MGGSDSSITYSGWNIDDVEIWGEAFQPAETSTPAPTRTPTPTWTPTAQASPTMTPPESPTPPTDTPQPSPTNTAPAPTDTPQAPPTSTPTAPPAQSFTPTFAPTSTETPIPARGMNLVLDDDDLGAGDRFSLHYSAFNPEPEEYECDAYILLAVYDNYWSWPGWSDVNEKLDKKSLTIAPNSAFEENALAFDWPPNVGAAEGLQFYGALFEKDGWVLIGTVQIINWQFH
jgi:hypothetical protein